MATAALITQGDLETAMYAARLVDCTDDDADGNADAAVVTSLRVAASSWLTAAAVMAGIEVPLDADRLSEIAKHHVCFWAAHKAAMRRPEYRDTKGIFPYDAEAEAAEAWRKAVMGGDEPIYTDQTAVDDDPTDDAIAVTSNPRRGW